MKLSEKILYCRKKALLSQETLAERVGVSRQAVSKWETGEAMPEVSKLLQLAQTFGVTTDWLLSEDEPEPESRAGQEPQWEPAYQPPESTHTWVDDVPGMIGKLLRKYGWLFGVRLAVSGAIFMAFGILVSLVSNSFFSSVGYGGSWYGAERGIVWYDENGNVLDHTLPDYSEEELFSMLGIQAPNTFSSFDSWDSTGRTIFGMFSGFVTLLGAVMLIGGVILAVQLKKINQT